MYYSNRRLWQSRTKICNKWYKTLYVPVVALSAQDNEKLLQQLKIGLKKQLTGKISIKTNSAGTKPIFKSLNWFKFSGSNRLFLLSFENDANRRSYKQ